MADASNTDRADPNKGEPIIVPIAEATISPNGAKGISNDTKAGKTSDSA
ncbi:hypothetical protein [Parapedobacter koreensis]|nr:hypothetical protein [Parapedobacter koreensis]